jgi:hypothetical protein
MAEGPARVRQVVDWSSAFWAGVLAGALFLALNLLVTPAVLGGNGWVFVRLLASITMGDGVLAPPATFDGVALAAALITHFALSIGYALLLAVIVHRWGVLASTAVGAAYGAALYGINIGTFTLIFPWFMTMHSGVFLLTHVIYGVAAGGVYEVLEVEELVPVGEPATGDAGGGEPT